eukprot:7913138-Pyramimonas_sp.AAC.1
MPACLASDWSALLGTQGVAYMSELNSMILNVNQLALRAQSMQASDDLAPTARLARDCDDLARAGAGAFGHFSGAFGAEEAGPPLQDAAGRARARLFGREQMGGGGERPRRNTL